MTRPPLVMAIASSGGHWVQLRRLRQAFPADRTIWVSTRRDLAHEVAAESRANRFHSVPDATRWDRLRVVWSALRVALLVLRYRPTHVVTTGAAPGLFGVMAGRIVGARTLWIDSMANVETLSMSGRRTLRWADEAWVQWPECRRSGEDETILPYHGSVL